MVFAHHERYGELDEAERKALNREWIDRLRLTPFWMQPVKQMQLYLGEQVTLRAMKRVTFGTYPNEALRKQGFTPARLQGDGEVCVVQRGGSTIEAYHWGGTQWSLQQSIPGGYMFTTDNASMMVYQGDAIVHIADVIEMPTTDDI